MIVGGHGRTTRAVLPQIIVGGHGRTTRPDTTDRRTPSAPRRPFLNPHNIGPQQPVQTTGGASSCPAHHHRLSNCPGASVKCKVLTPASTSSPDAHPVARIHRPRRLFNLIQLLSPLRSRAGSLIAEHGCRVAPADRSAGALTRSGQGDFHHPAPPPARLTEGRPTGPCRPGPVATGRPSAGC